MVQHATLAQASECTNEALRAYFLHGRLPADGTVCRVDEPLF